MNKLGCIACTVLFFLGMYIFYPRHAMVEVTDIGWECDVNILELKTVKESDWNIPSGARVYDECSEVYSYMYVNGIPLAIYETKYYYYIERWVESRVVKTTGNDKSPYYGEVELAPPSGEYGVGEEAEKNRRTIHTITGKVDGESRVLIIDDESWWQEINIGDKINGDITFCDHLKRKG